MSLVGWSSENEEKEKKEKETPRESEPIWMR
jgi:hypothetical protein